MPFKHEKGQAVLGKEQTSTINRMD
jgi:hypothetical protein